jgi:hypothetical protein
MVVIPRHHHLICGGVTIGTFVSPLYKNNVWKIKQKEEEKKGAFYALTGFSCAIFHMKKNPRASITVRTPSA